MNICVYGGANSRINARYMEEGERLGRCMAKRGHSLVFGGGANGMMGAVARGITAGGGKAIGVCPSFFNVDGKLFEPCSPMYLTETMRERKAKLEDLSDAFVVSPGGVGTLDEFFEILTLRNLKRHKKPVVLFNIDGFYDSLMAFLNEANSGRFIDNECMALVRLFSDPEEMLTYLEANA